MASGITREMLISQDQAEVRVAICEDKRLAELYVERSKRSVVGNIYLGKVTDVLPGMQAAFIDIGLEKNAYLYVDDIRVDGTTPESSKRQISSYLSTGQTLMVQVVKDAMGTKGARVTMGISLPGRFLVFLPFAERRAVSKKIGELQREHLLTIMEEHLPPGMGAIARTAARDATPADLIADIDFLTRVWNRVQRQSTEVVAPDTLYTEIDLAMRCVRDIFSSSYTSLTVDNKQIYDKVQAFVKRSAPELGKRIHLYRDKGGEALFSRYGIEDAIDGSLRREVGLPSGGFLVIDKTEALVTIDVNTGSFVGRRTLEETLLKTNIEAAEEALRQLRLRDLGGIIIIDFIDMELEESKTRLMEVLRETLERDRTRTKLVGLDSLGLVEITRKNTTDGLFSLVTEVCPFCEGEGRRLSPQTRRIELDRRLRSYVTHSKAQSFLFAVNAETYEIVTAAGVNLAAAIKADTGKEVRLTPDLALGLVELRCLLEGHSPTRPTPKKQTSQTPQARLFGKRP